MSFEDSVIGSLKRTWHRGFQCGYKRGLRQGGAEQTADLERIQEDAFRVGMAAAKVMAELDTDDPFEDERESAPWN